MERTRPPRAVEIMLRYFGSLEDPRIDRTKAHPLENIIVMALCGAIAGADGWDALEAFAESRAEWFATFLDMPNGTPSADTFRRVFSALDPIRFADQFRHWMVAFAGELEGEVVAIDGKTLRGAVGHATQESALHLLHVWATEQQLLLAQRAVAGAPGEVQAIPELIKLLDLKGAVVTTDANGCTATVTQAIRDAGADYVLALKGNRGRLHAHVEQQFETAAARSYHGVPTFRSKETSHGRTEERVVRALHLEDWESSNRSQWVDLNTIALVERTRVVAGKSTAERHFYIASLPADAKRIAHAVRAHWGIENQLHWCLDVAFDEDRRRIRDEVAAQNFATIARYALSLLTREKTAKYGLPTKRKKAAWDNDYLMRVLTGGLPSQ
jgi:predicted transposase YbfD/YdcC